MWPVRLAESIVSPWRYGAVNSVAQQRTVCLWIAYYLNMGRATEAGLGGTARTSSWAPPFPTSDGLPAITGPDDLRTLFLSRHHAA
jgi:hypothetical protein